MTDLRADIAALDHEIGANLAIARRLASPVRFACCVCSSTNHNCAWCGGVAALTPREAFRIHDRCCAQSGRRSSSFPLPQPLTFAELAELQQLNLARSTLDREPVLSTTDRRNTMKTIRFLKTHYAMPFGLHGGRKAYPKFSVHDVDGPMAFELIAAGIAEPADPWDPDGVKNADLDRVRQDLAHLERLESQIATTRLELLDELQQLEGEFAIARAIEATDEDASNAVLRAFIDACTTDASSTPATNWTPPTIVHEAYSEWARSRRAEPMGHREMLEAIREMGVDYRKSGVYRLALTLNNHDQPACEASP